VKNQTYRKVFCAVALTSALACPWLVSACHASGAQGAADAPGSAPKIELVESQFDFGNVVEGDTVKHVFVVKNAGNSTLNIERVQTTCGCTAAVLKSKEIPPAGTSEIEISFNTQGKPGAQTKSVTVVSNDLTNPRAQISFKANVEQLLVFDQRSASKTLRYGAKESAEVWLSGKLADSAKLQIEKVNGEDVTVELISKTEGDKPRAGLRIDFKGSKIGNFRGDVTVTTAVEQVPKLTLPFSWNTTGNIEMIPRMLSFSVSGPPGRGDERIIQLRSKLADFKLNSARVPSGPFSAKISRPDAGAAYEIRVAVTDRDKLEKATNCSVEISTNDPIEPKLTVPITVASGRGPMMPPSIRPPMPMPMPPAAR
jgi:hypothetical protein